MRQHRVHSRFFGAIYGYPQLANIPGGVDVRVFGVSARTFKHFSVSRADTMAGTAHLRRIARINEDHGNSASFGLVLDKSSELMEVPTTDTRAKDTTFRFAVLAYPRQLFQRDSLVLLLRHFYDAFCNRVVHDRSRSSFASRKPFQGFFTALRAFGLKRRSNVLSFDAVLLNLFAGKFFARRKCRDVHESEVHTDEIFNLKNVFFGYFDRLKQIPLAFLGHQIGLALDIGKEFFVVTDERKALDAAVGRPKADCPILDIIRENSRIVGDRTQKTERALRFPVQFVSVRNFRNRAHYHLRGKAKGFLDGAIRPAVKFKLVKDLVRPSVFGNLAACPVGFLGCREQRLGLGRIG